MTVYLLLKMIHVMAVIIFLGNIITGVFWMRHASRSRNRLLVFHAMKGIIKSDKWFTIPAIIIITAGGFAAAIHGNYPILRTGWIFWSIVAFSLSGIFYGWKLAPLQQRICHMTRDKETGEKEDFSWEAFHRQYQSWERWGAASLITPLAALVMMILKIPTTTIFFQ